MYLLSMYRLFTRKLRLAPFIAGMMLSNLALAQAPSAARQAQSESKELSTGISKSSGNEASGAATSNSAPVFPISTHERFATFLADDGFQSELLLQNLRLDAAVVATPSLIIDNKEVPLGPITLAPHTVQTLDLNARLGLLGFGPAHGAVVVRYDFSTYAAVGMVVIASNPGNSLYLVFSGQSGEEFWVGNSSDAVVWAPDKDTEGFISLINTYSEPVRTRIALTAGRHNHEVREVEIAPHRQELLKIDSLVRQSTEQGAGIHVQFTGEPGAIIAQGTLLNRKTGFAKRIQFTDSALKFATPSLRTHFLLLGRQKIEDNFPAQIDFRSVAAIRNVDSAPVQVVPVIKYLQNGSVRKFMLEAFQLGVNETRLIDFSEERRMGRLPFDFSQASLELVPNTDHTSIISELFNFDSRTGGYVVGPSFGAHPMRSTSSIWRIDGRFETTVMIENTGDRDDKVTLSLFSDGGTYEKDFDVPHGGLVKVSLREIQKDGILDKNGKPLSASSGSLHLSGSFGSRSTLAYDKLIHSTDVSEYVGLPASPCDYVQDFSGSLEGGENPFTPTITEYWTDGTIDSFASSPSSSNQNLVEVTTDSAGDPEVIVNGSPDGLSHTVTLDFTDMILDCTACSTRQADRLLQVSVPACPTSVSISGTTTFILENFFPGRKTGVGIVSSMLAGPAGNFNGIPISESISTSFVLQQTCPAPVFPNVCTGSSTFIVGNGVTSTDPVSGFTVVKPPVPNTFYDFHTTLANSSLLDDAHINSCTTGCIQTYSCNGLNIGTFTVIRTFTKDTIQGTPVTRMSVSKQ
jgi:hypothetical protein